MRANERGQRIRARTELKMKDDTGLVRVSYLALSSTSHYRRSQRCLCALGVLQRAQITCIVYLELVGLSNI
jgi:hypothetical protein